MNKFILLLLLTSFATYSQEITQRLIYINTIEDANKFAQENPDFYIEFVSWTPEIENEEAAQEMADSKIGEIFADDEFAYKIFEITNIPAFRASYIYLDGSKLSLKEINKLRSKILEEYARQKDFTSLFRKYNMDGRQTDGDLGWFITGTMVPEFEDAVKTHKENDIFKVDVPSRKWYYIVLKSFDNIEIKRFTLLKINKVK